MNRPKTIPGLLLAAALLAVLWGGVNSPFAQDMSAAPKQSVWTLAEALTQLTLHPQDAYFQYVALQLARREGRFEEAEVRVRNILPNAASARADRRDSVDLFSIFNGALAVQESLQLDTMRFATPGRAVNPRPTEALPPGFIQNPADSGSRNSGPIPAPTPARAGTRRGGQARRRGAPVRATGEVAKEIQSASRPDVPVSNLSGPTVKSHPWEQMLGRRKPEVSALARSVPEDFYFVEFRTLNKLLEAFDAGELWGGGCHGSAVPGNGTPGLGRCQRRSRPDPRNNPPYRCP